MGRVLENKPIANQWLYKYGFVYDSNCYAGKCRGFERYYKNEPAADGQDTILWVTINTAKRVIYLLTEYAYTNGYIKDETVSIPNEIDINDEVVFTTWLDSIVK